jgi:hypothetical protein
VVVVPTVIPEDEDNTPRLQRPMKRTNKRPVVVNNRQERPEIIELRQQLSVERLDTLGRCTFKPGRESGSPSPVPFLAIAGIRMNARWAN